MRRNEEKYIGRGQEDNPIFFSFFPARSFGIELEFYGRLLRFLPEICLSSFWFCSFLEERESRENRRFTRPNMEQKKTSCSTQKCYTRS